MRNTGHGNWSTKTKKSVLGQGKSRKKKLADIDSDLPSKKKERGETKRQKIVDARKKEHHHLKADILE